MKKSKIFERAVNSEQYNFEDLEWEAEGSNNSARTGFFREYLSQYYPEFKGKDILDIGAGIGWLVNDLKKSGANFVLGIEPSTRNKKFAEKQNPDSLIIETSFENYANEGRTFDVVVSVMTFSHLKDISEAFSKIFSLLKEDGELIIIVPDFKYFKLPRHDYEIEMESLNDKEYVISVKRSSGKIADIVRENSVYENAAALAGFHLSEIVAMFPTPDFISKVPKYSSLRNQPISQILRFKKF